MDEAPKEPPPTAVPPVEPATPPEPSEHDTTLATSVESNLDEIMAFRRRVGYVTIAAAVAAGVAIVWTTLRQMPSMARAWDTGEVNVEALIVLSVAHVGVTVASVFAIVRLLAIGERLALPHTMTRHANQLLGRSDPARTLRRTVTSAADVVGRARGQTGD